MGLITSENEEFDRVRTSAGSIDASDGRYDEGSQSTTRFEDGNFQSISEDDIETLPEGERSRAEYKVLTSADLRGVDQTQDPPVPADHVVRQETGEEFEVRRITDKGDLLPDEKIILLRLQED